ncbi:MAG TPA: DUF4192 domain-containing protein [Micromonosporaceae bacterium]|jgi:hypothetical protein
MPSTKPEMHRLVLRSLADLLALVPYMIGFHPTDSVVVVALRGKRVVFAARSDLPTATASAAERRGLAGYIASVVSQQMAAGVAVIGYGDADAVAPAVRAVGDALAGTGLAILDEIRVAGDRYWCLQCDDPECCPPEGIRFDPEASEVAAAATYAGEVALPDRAALAHQVAPVGGPARESMAVATARAEDRLRLLVDGAADADLLGARAVRIAGEEAVREAMSRHRDGAGLSDDEVAWLSLLLSYIPVRDYAWRQLTGPDDWQLTLWTDVLRRAEPALAAPPASLLAFTAWRAGRGALAAVALERALAADPAYSMAVLLDEAVHSGIPPSALDGWPNARQAGRAARRKRGSGNGRRRAVRR